MPKISVLCYCSLAELNSAEIYWMAEYDCYPNGYNQKPGGGFIRTGLVDVPYLGVEDNTPIFCSAQASIDRLDSPSFRKTMEHTPIMDIFKVVGLATVCGLGWLLWVNPPAAIGVIFLLGLILKLQ